MTATVVPVKSWQLWGLLLAVISLQAAAIEFNVYEPCGGLQTTSVSVPQCRRELAAAALARQRQQTVGVAAVPQQLPVDMRLPCEDRGIECHKNIDVMRIPAVPRGPSINSCSHSLMPWSPFPCTYNTNSSFGTPNQTTDYCYTAPPPSAAATQRMNSPRTNLTTDGYHNVYFGLMPGGLCSDGSQIKKLLLTLDFRLAAGRQFDRTYSFQIGRAVAAFGTCSEPSRLIKADKYWSVTVDITHLQTYIKLGMFTRFSLSNVLSNTYNVPIWAKADLSIYYQTPPPSTSTVIKQSTPDITEVSPSLAGQARKESDLQPNSKQPVSRSRQSRTDHANPEAVSKLKDDVSSAAGGSAAAGLALPADVPSEVLPLWSGDQSGSESLSSVAGNGVNPAYWPNVTFPLSQQLSERRNIYRAQLLVVPKANGCEEFWAMNPPDPEANSTCDGVSTGQPYREIRVYVDGQLAGFYPIFYTMYTGGVDPRLWTAIVAPYAHSLPVYTFDLGPWLGLLNTPVTQDSNSSNTAKPHSVTVEVYGATGSNWLLANTLLIWRSSSSRDESQLDEVLSAGELKVTASPGLSNPAVSSCKGGQPGVTGDCVTTVEPRMLSVETLLKVGGSFWVSNVKYELKSYSNHIIYNNTDGTASWNQTTALKASCFTGLERSLGSSTQQYLVTRRSKGTDVQEQGALKPSPPRDRVLAAERKPSQQLSSGPSAVESSRGAAGDLELSAGVKGANSVITQNARQFDWLVVGGIYPMAPFVFGYNETLLAPTVYSTPRLGSKASGRYSISAVHDDDIVITGKQRLHQQSVMLNVYDTKKPACPEPRYPTYFAVLHSSIGLSSGSGSSVVGAAQQDGNKLCESWTASCAFCSPSLLVNNRNVTYCVA